MKLFIYFLMGMTTVIAPHANKNNFIIVVLPDTQNYAEFYPEINNSQCEWIVANKDNIDMVIHLGDLVNNSSVTAQWDVADTCMHKIYGEVPILIIPGNHEGNLQNYNVYFPYTELDTMDYWGGYFPDTAMYNSYGFAVKGSDSLLILGMQWCPDSSAIDWADSVLDMYSHLPTVFFTHNFLYLDGERSDTVNCGVTCSISKHAGKQIWECLMYNRTNIFLIISGHYAGIAKRLDFIDGYPCYQVLKDYQGGNRGGDGWLDIITVNYQMNRIDIDVYSPYLDCFNGKECDRWCLYENEIISAKQK